MYCHFTLMNELSVKHNGKCLGYESFVLNVLCYGRDVCMAKTRVCVVLWSFHVGWICNRIDFLALSVTFHLYSSTLLLVLLLLLHYAFRPPPSRTSGGIQ